MNLNGAGVSGSGALTNSGTAATYGGAVALQSASTIGGSGNITLTNTISGAFGLSLCRRRDLDIERGEQREHHHDDQLRRVRQVGAGGTSGVLGSGAVTDNGTLIFDRTDSYGGSVGNAISGGGGVTVSGGGTLTLTASNGLTGGFTIENGTVSTSNNNGLGSTGATVYLGSDSNSATLLFTGTPGPAQNIVVASGGTRTIQANNGVTAANGVVDADTITLNGNLDLAETGTGNIQFRGNITGAGNVIIDTDNTGAVMLQGTNNFSSLTVKAGYVTAQTSSSAFGAGTIHVGGSCHCVARFSNSGR